MMSYDAVLIAGPTASGKSQAALALAETLGADIVNADAMQVYRELEILTARPSREDMRRVPHHLYGHVSVREPYSVGRYAAEAAHVFARIRESGRTAIFVGGTGLYFAALVEGLADIPAVPAQIRARVRARIDEIGAAAFHAELAEHDPEMAANLLPSDRHRLVRAREVLEATGQSLAVWQRAGSRPTLGAARLAKFVLEVSRETIRARIETRFHAMMAAGAGDELDALVGLDPALPAAKILGARELLAARAGALDEQQAVARAVALTRQYAKRQVTWARHRMTDWAWIGGDGGDNIVAEMLRHFT